MISETKVTLNKRNLEYPIDAIKKLCFIFYRNGPKSQSKDADESDL